MYKVNLQTTCPFSGIHSQCIMRDCKQGCECSPGGDPKTLKRRNARRRLINNWRYVLLHFPRYTHEPPRSVISVTMDSWLMNEMLFSRGHDRGGVRVQVSRGKNWKEGMPHFPAPSEFPLPHVRHLPLHARISPSALTKKTCCFGKNRIYDRPDTSMDI